MGDAMAYPPDGNLVDDETLGRIVSDFCSGCKCLRVLLAEDERSWCKLMVEIAKLDPSWTDEMSEPEFNDPEFYETYDPWEGLRLIHGQLATMWEALEAIKIRIHFIGMPQEPTWQDGELNVPDWRKEIDLLEKALASDFGKPESDVIAAAEKVSEAHVHEASHLARSHKPTHQRAQATLVKALWELDKAFEHMLHGKEVNSVR